MDLYIILYIKCDVFLEATLNCSGNDGITPGPVLESWDIIFFNKATLVNICWPLLTFCGNENSSKSWFFAKFLYFQSQIHDIRSQQVLTKIILMKSMKYQLSKTVPGVILSFPKHFLNFRKITSLLLVFWKFQKSSKFITDLKFFKNLI